MHEKKCVLALDAGGTYFKAAMVDSKGTVIPGTYVQEPVSSKGDTETVLGTYEKVIVNILNKRNRNKVIGIGISTPGPFDYSKHRSLMTHKFKSIYGINLKRELLSRCGLPAGMPVEFLHDVHAFLLGENWRGAAGGFKNVIAVTIGTGIGFGLMKEGMIIDNGSGGPYLSLFQMKYGPGTVEDRVSGRGIVEQYRRLGNAKKQSSISAADVADLARKKDESAVSVFHEIGYVLAEVLNPIIEENETECLVLGGQVSRSFDLFHSSLRSELASGKILHKITVGKNIECSSLVGAAKSLLDGNYIP